MNECRKCHSQYLTPSHFSGRLVVECQKCGAVYGNPETVAAIRRQRWHRQLRWLAWFGGSNTALWLGILIFGWMRHSNVNPLLAFVSCHVITAIEMGVVNLWAFIQWALAHRQRGKA